MAGRSHNAGGTKNVTKRNGVGPLCGRWRTALMSTFVVAVATIAVVRADDITVIVLGAADGQLKVLSNTGTVATPLLVESTSKTDIDISVRASPFRDGAGRVYPSELTLVAPRDAVLAFSAIPLVPANSGAGRTTAATPPAETKSEVSTRLISKGTATVWLKGTLIAEGDYTSDIYMVYGDRRDHVRLLVTRAPSELGVEIQGLDDTVRAIASPINSSSATLHVTLLEKVGRAVQINVPLLAKRARKDPSGARSQADYELDKNSLKELPLGPYQSLQLNVPLNNFDGAGEYSGTLRFASAGLKPVDKDFTVNLRESRYVAFVVILAGVALSIILQNLSGKLRPRLLETRRASLIQRELDELLNEPGRDEEELGVLRALRREAVSLQVKIDSGEMDGVTIHIDQLAKRSTLTTDWIRSRRRVGALLPATLRANLWPDVDEARRVIVKADATEKEVSDASTELSQLDKKINETLRLELSRRITTLRDGLNALNARPMSTIAIAAPAQMNPLLDQAEKEVIAGQLSGALQTYSSARRIWVSMLLDDLAETLSGDTPVGIADSEWTRLKPDLHQQLSEARRLLDSDSDAAIEYYGRVWARYFAIVSEGLAGQLDKLRRAARDNKDLAANERERQLQEIEAAAANNAAARKAAAEGKSQEALAALAAARQAASRVERSDNRAVREGEMVESFAATSSVGIGQVPDALVDVPGSQFKAPEQTLRETARKLFRVDLFITTVAILLATLFGVRTLWSANATWGGWEDHVVALLWGLGLHQLTWAGVGAFRDKIQGKAPSGA